MNFRPPTPIATLVCAAFLISGCGYEGDGQYQSQGVWPFKNYLLVLPEFSFESEYSGQFDLSGYKSHGRSLLRLKLTSSNPHKFHQLDTLVEMKVSDDLGTTYFYRNGPLNEHYQRMVAEGETSWPLETEWNARYSYGRRDIDARAVPFSLNSDPQPVTEIEYSHFLPTGERPMTITVNVSGVQQGLDDPIGQITLLSGWK